MTLIISLLLLFTSTAPERPAITDNPVWHKSVQPVTADTVDDPPHTTEVRVLRHQPVPMRDGTILYADVYLPAEPGEYPTIVTRTPYGVQRPGRHERYIKFAQQGYAKVAQDTRGAFESEGEWEPFRTEAEDGHDTIEWAASQPWSNGKVVSSGGSYLGHNQWAAASQKPPSLVAAFPAVASTNIYSNWITMGGAFRLAFNYGWGVVRMPSGIMLPQTLHTADYIPELNRYENILRTLPLREMDLLSGEQPVQHWRDWIDNESYNDYWQEFSDEERFGQVTVPTYSHGGWFDVFIQGTINGYIGMRNHGGSRKAREGARLRIGPWEHGQSRTAGEFDFGEEAYINKIEDEIRFFDYHLKGIDNGFSEEKPVQLFYMGINKWRGEDDFPVPGTEYRNVYLESNGNANSLRGDGLLTFSQPGEQGIDSYRYDPANPVPTLGGNNCCGAPTISGPRDQRPLERRDDVLVYTSDYLEEELTIAGPVRMVLHAATDGPDTDWMIKLSDVHPDGTSFPIAEGILRARFHEGLDEVNLLTPGEAYEFEIDMTGTANVFQPGHRIRVSITSSNFPQFNRNLNTGAPLGTGDEIRVANQTIYHGGPSPSHIVLPVVRDFDMEE
ncbi:MAG: CocE/NonD family hydrolase [Balneolaceae bacterium]